MNKESLGNVLRIFRLANDLSITDMSRYTGLSVSYICEIEKGKKLPSSITIQNFLKVFNIDNTQLFNILEYYESIEKSNKLERYQLTLIKSLELLLNNRVERKF